MTWFESIPLPLPAVAMHLLLWNAHHIIRHPIRLLLIFAVILADGRLGMHFIGLQDFAHGGVQRLLRRSHRVMDMGVPCAPHAPIASPLPQRYLSIHRPPLWGHVRNKGRMLEPTSFIHTMNALRIQHVDIPLIKASYPFNR